MYMAKKVKAKGINEYLKKGLIEPLKPYQTLSFSRQLRKCINVILRPPVSTHTHSHADLLGLTLRHY